MTVMVGFFLVSGLLSQSVFVAVNGFILSPLPFHASESTALFSLGHGLCGFGGSFHSKDITQESLSTGSHNYLSSHRMV
jgi:hypothetical protein